MRKFTKIVGFILAMVMLVSIMVVSVSAEEHHGNMGNLQWEYNSETKTLTISGEGEMPRCIAEGPRPWEIPNVIEKKDIKHIIIGDGITSIGSYVFENLINLETVSIPDSVQNIEIGAFRFCAKLTEVHLPEGLTRISESTFNACSGLRIVNIPSTVTEIQRLAFTKCYALENLTFPEGLKKIGEYAFGSMEAMDTVNLPKTVTTIEDKAFNNCTGLKNINIDPQNAVYTSIDGVLFTKDMKTLLCRPAGKTDETYIVPASVTKISSGALNGNKMKSVVLPEGLTKLEDNQFKSCVNLNSVNFPASLTSVGTGAFYNTGFESLVFPETVNYIGGGVVINCTKLTDISILNPRCQFGGNYTFTTVGNTAIIHGYLDSTAQTYAIKYGNPFDLLNPFFDVKEGKWFYKPVMWAYENRVTTGTNFHEFSPDKPCTRAQVVTFLWRAFGSPEPTLTESPFEDVQKTNAYYYKAVLWAYEKGITTGIGNGKFGTDEICNRAQIVTFLWRSFDSPCPCPNAYNPFVDVQNGYYKVAVMWAVQNSITAGIDDTHFAPDAVCTRSQIVTFLYRAIVCQPEQTLTVIAHDITEANNVADTMFYVYDKNGEQIYSGATDADGKMEVPAEKLKEGETYTVEELVPNGYLCQSENPKVITSDKKNKVVDFYNADTNGVLVVVEDSNGNGVDGVQLYLDYYGLDYQIDDHCTLVSQPGGACIAKYFENSSYDLNEFLKNSCVDRPILDGHDIRFTFQATNLPENMRINKADIILKRANGTEINKWTTTEYSPYVGVTNDNTFVMLSNPFYGAYAYQEDANLLIRIVVGN